MNNLKKKALLLGMLTELTAISLTGCGNSYSIKEGDFKIVYEEDNTITGTISYKDVENYIKIITIEQREMTKKYLMIKKDEYHMSRHSSNTQLKYIDLEDGTEMLHYYYGGRHFNEEELKNREPDEIFVGKDIKILEEESLTTYLMQQDKIKREYDVNDLISFYHNNVEVLPNESTKSYKIK